MGFFEAINSVFAGFFKFSGRATRAEFWWFFLFEVIAFTVLGAVDAVMAFNVLAAAGGNELALLTLSPFDFMLTYYFIITFFPRLTVTIRRLHDVGLSGFFYLFYFVPFVGGLVVFVLTLLPSEADDNIHGPHYRPTGGPRRDPEGRPRKHDPMQGYAVLDRVNAPVTPEMQAARKAEVRALYEQRVLGKGPIVAE
ncbi:DUF805 domain-containing protein [uncultured Tateyamaria sp.]|uniref:DUF805 domain-containing protein n=1 Tax=uncultured Tateyamaria sp. TaxID=455651 RepID=UPI00260E488C|nr:DUF805 domain-containing protein [uncultured Tateyamaria sp.]